MKTKGALWMGQQERVGQDSTVATVNTADRCADCGFDHCTIGPAVVIPK